MFELIKTIHKPQQFIQLRRNIEAEEEGSVRKTAVDTLLRWLLTQLDGISVHNPDAGYGVTIALNRALPLRIAHLIDNMPVPDIIVQQSVHLRGSDAMTWIVVGYHKALDHRTQQCDARAIGSLLTAATYNLMSVSDERMCDRDDASALGSSELVSFALSALHCRPRHL